MDQKTKINTEQMIEILAPVRQTAPVIFSSPHSGRIYPADFLDLARLDKQAIRRSEDCFVDEIFAKAPYYGAPLLKALFPRAYVDPNREPYELDPTMFKEPIPDFVNKCSPRVAAGLGTIARIVANGSEIYESKLNFREANERIDRCYHPYHSALEDLINNTQEIFGYCILIDCHSMPSIIGKHESKIDFRPQVDFVLGDSHGRSCSPSLTMLVQEIISDMGYRVVRNAPYSGGFITRNYGRPTDGIHALQIEIKRGLYMDEDNYTRNSGMSEIIQDMTYLTEQLVSLEPQALAA